MKSKIQEILDISPEKIEAMSDSELEKLLGPLLPMARQPSKEAILDQSAMMIERLQKMFAEKKGIKAK